MPAKNNKRFAKLPPLMDDLDRLYNQYLNSFKVKLKKSNKTSKELIERNSYLLNYELSKAFHHRPRHHNLTKIDFHPVGQQYPKDHKKYKSHDWDMQAIVVLETLKELRNDVDQDANKTDEAVLKKLQEFKSRLNDYEQLNSVLKQEMKQVIDNICQKEKQYHKASDNLYSQSVVKSDLLYKLPKHYKDGSTPISVFYTQLFCEDLLDQFSSELSSTLQEMPNYDELDLPLEAKLDMLPWFIVSRGMDDRSLKQIAECQQKLNDKGYNFDLVSACKTLQEDPINQANIKNVDDWHDLRENLKHKLPDYHDQTAVIRREQTAYRSYTQSSVNKQRQLTRPSNKQPNLVNGSYQVKPNTDEKGFNKVVEENPARSSNESPKADPDITYKMNISPSK